MAKKKEKSFEEILAQTEDIVDNLESSDIGLEDALKLYEEGVGGLRKCVSMVKGAEEKVKILLESSKDAFELAEFESAEDEE